MKRFLLDILLFVVLILGLAVVCDIMISSGLRKTTIRKYSVWNDIYNGNNLDNDMVLLGSSACWALFNPNVIDSITGIKTYNLGIDGHTWYPCEPLRYDTYVRYTRKPKYIAIIIDDALFDVEGDPYEREQFFPYFWLDDSLVSQVRECKEITFLERYCPMWRYIGYRTEIETGIASVLGQKNFEDDGVYKGYRGHDFPFDRASLNTLDSVTIPYNTAIVDSLLCFIAQRKAEGQNVVLVKSPIYHELQERFTNHREMCERYDSIASVAGVPLIDYWNHSIVQDSNYFYNSMHLNSIGADVISAQLAHDLDSIGLMR